MVQKKSVDVYFSTFLFLLALIIITPIFLMFISALKDDRYEIMKDMGSLKAFVVLHPTLHNFHEILFESVQDFARSFINSMIVLATTVFLTAIVCSMTGYALQRGKLKIRKFIFIAVLSLYIIPMEAIMLPLMYQVSSWKITDTYIVQILPFVASPLYIYLFYNYFKEIPVSLSENAELEGATFFQIFKDIYLPINKAPIITVCILQGMDMWNQYLWPLLVTTEQKVRPMSVAISSFTGTGGDIYWDQLMAASVVMLLPVLVMFAIFQKQFIESVGSTAVKG